MFSSVALPATDTDQAFNDMVRLLRCEMAKIKSPPMEDCLTLAEYKRLDEMYRMLKAIEVLPKPSKKTLSRLGKNHQLAAVRCSAETWGILVGSNFVNGKNVVSNGEVVLTHLDIR
jgi:hypothetical protein